ncbi:MAG: hypothetical protein ACP5P2_02225 [Candidatus Micrarchaeia archaeon]|jgi:hypothetical protein
MSNRSIINKYELLVNEVRRVSKKRKPETAEEVKVKDEASLVASLSSSHSWKTYKYLHDGGELDKDAIIMEANAAFSEGWKNITEKDIEEVINSNIDEYLISTWFFYAVDKEKRDYYKNLLEEMKAELADGIEPIEKSEE